MASAFVNWAISCKGIDRVEYSTDSDGDAAITLVWYDDEEGTEPQEQCFAGFGSFAQAEQAARVWLRNRHLYPCN